MLNTAKIYDYKALAYQTSFLNDLFKSKCQTKFIKIIGYVILNINMSSFKTPALLLLHILVC